MLTIETDLGDMIPSLKRLAKAQGLDVRILVYDQLRLWGNDLIRLTPPKTLSQGIGAVTRDINRLFAGADRPFENFLEDEILGEGRLPASVLFNLDGNIARMEGFHKKHRDKRGRVRKRSAEVGKIGDIGFHNKMYVPKRKLTAYIKKRKAKVGTLKAGWLPGTDHYAIKSRGRVRAPAWIRRGQRQLGFTFGNIRADGNGDAGMANAVAYAEAARLERLAAITGRTRQLDIVRTAEKRMGQLVDRFNRAA